MLFKFSQPQAISRQYLVRGPNNFASLESLSPFLIPESHAAK